MPPAPPSRARPRWRGRVAIALSLAVASVISAAVWATVLRNDHPCRSSKGVGIAGDPDAPMRPLPSTPQDAIRTFTPGAPRMTADPVPVDGWTDERGRWVHDMSEGAFYEITMQETGRGWQVNAYQLCMR